MNPLNACRLTWVLLVAAGLVACGTPIRKVGYPNAWPPPVNNRAQGDCSAISGRYKAISGDSPLPFFLFGIPDTTSNEWRNLVRVGERILSKPEEASVTVIAPDPDHIEVRVAMGDVPIAAQILTRSRTSGDYAEGISGQGDRSFRCELDRVVVVGAYVCDWEAYRLPIETKRARYRRPGKNDVGTARGYFDFLRAADGSLVMRQRLYLSIGCDGLDERWRRWEPAPGQPANPR